MDYGEGDPENSWIKIYQDVEMLQNQCSPSETPTEQTKEVTSTEQQPSDHEKYANSEPSNEMLTRYVSNLLTKMPSVVVGQILSYLAWKDKLNAVTAFPSWAQHLRSPDAWHWFYSNYSSIVEREQLDHQLLRRLHQIACWCVRHYGHHFQNCVIVLHYLDLVDMGLELIEHVAKNCPNIKTLRVYHPDPLFFGEKVFLERYVYLFKQITLNCRSLRHVALCNMNYMAISFTTGIQELFEPLVVEKISSSIHELEFCHANDFICPMLCLMSFNNLRKLKCPIQVLSTDTILSLATKNLRHLCVINNGLHWALDIQEFDEFTDIKWHEIAKVAPALEVHYLIHTSMIRPSDFVSNPLVRTLVLDTPYLNVSIPVVEAIIRCYGSSLLVYAQLNVTCFPNCDIPAMFALLVRGCRKMHTFLSAVEMPSAALSLIATNRKLKNFWVEDKRISFEFESNRTLGYTEEMEYVDWWETNTACLDSLQHALSKFLGYDWRPLNQYEMSEKIKLLTRF